jgi:hypothetical protein
MFEGEIKTARKVLGPIAETALIGYAVGVLGGMSVTLRGHRQLTHRSVSLPRWVERGCDFEQRTVTVNTILWSAVHRIHHQMPDVALAPFGRITNAVNWVRDNPDQFPGAKIPEAYPHLDPFVQEFTLDQVMEIGGLTNKFLRDRLGERYRPPESYTAEELKALLHPEQPTYLYPSQPHVGDYTLQEMEDILTGDPHSPVRFHGANGVRSELFHFPKLNDGAAGLLRAHPELIPKDLQSEDGQYKRYGKLDLALGFGIATAAVLLARGKYSPKDLLRAAIQGSAINGIKIGLQIIGGNTVNSLGHAGSLTEGQAASAVRSQKYKIEVNKDGTVSANVERAGWTGVFLGGFTLDEVGGQGEHHDDPSKIAYTSETGPKAWREAPWGSLISLLAKSKWFPLINPGAGFELREGETRPDEAHPAVAIIQRIRAEQIAKQLQSS